MKHGWQIIDPMDQFDDEEWSEWLALELLMPADWSDPVLRDYLCAELAARHSPAPKHEPQRHRRRCAHTARHTRSLVPPGCRGAQPRRQTNGEQRERLTPRRAP